MKKNRHAANFTVRKLTDAESRRLLPAVAADDEKSGKLPLTEAIRTLVPLAETAPDKNFVSTDADEMPQTSATGKAESNRTEQIAHLRKVLQDRAKKKDKKQQAVGGTLAAALNEQPTASVADKIAAFVIPDSEEERLQLCRRLKLLPCSPKKILRLKSCSEPVNPAEAREKLQLSRRLITTAGRRLRIMQVKAYRKITDEQISAAYADLLHNGRDLSANGESTAALPAAESSIVLSANRRRRLRQQLRNRRKLQLLKHRFAYKRKKQELSGVRQIQSAWHKFGDYFRKLRISAAIIVLIAGIILSLVALLPQFYLQEVEIHGNRNLTAREINSLLGKQKGRHLITLINGNLWQLLQGRNHKLELQLQEHYPIVAAAECKVALPAKLVVNLQESTEIAYIKIPGGYAGLDKNGRILAIEMGEPNKNVPLIKGLDTSVIQVNSLFDQINDRRFANALVFIDSLMRSDSDSSDRQRLMPCLTSVNLMPDASLWLDFSFPKNQPAASGQAEDSTKVRAEEASKPEPAAASTVDDRYDALTVHVGNNIGNYANLIYWLRNTKQAGALSNLGHGYLDLTGTQKVFVKAKDNETETAAQKGKLKAEPWDNSAWTWKDIVVKSFKKKVGD